MEALTTFSPEEIQIVTDSTVLAEELVSNHYKMSASQWLHPRYDVKTLADLDQTEIVHGPFAQIIRYEAKKKDATLGSSTYDFYKICIQDHSILTTIDQNPEISLSPFTIYIITHELVHIVRFGKFLQNFTATQQEAMQEEKRVHDITHEILRNVLIPGVTPVFKFYEKWRRPIEKLQNPQ